MKRLKRILIALISLYILIGVAFYFLQDRILFRPISLKKEHKYDFPQKHKDINIRINESSNLNIVQFFPEDSGSSGVILYFHGNKKNISRYAQYTEYFTQHGYEVWMIDYPGFGKSTGKFTEQNLYDWATLMYELAKSKFHPDHIIIYGKSMGTGIAAELATRRDSRRLILETPYYDLPSAVSHYLPVYPIRRMLHYQLPTHEYLRKVSVPITIFHGTKDRTIKFSNAKRLVKTLKPTDEFITVVGGGHNDLFNYEQVRVKLEEILK